MKKMTLFILFILLVGLSFIAYAIQIPPPPVPQFPEQQKLPKYDDVSYGIALRGYYQNYVLNNPNDQSICLGKSDETFKKYCRDVYKEDVVHGICSDNWFKDICLQEFALKTKNAELCSSMENKKFRQSCYQYTNFELNFYWLNIILIRLLIFGIILGTTIFSFKKIKDLKWNVALTFAFIGLLLFRIGVSMEQGANEGGDPLFSKLPKSSFLVHMVLFPCFSPFGPICPYLGYYAWYLVVPLFYGFIGFIIGWFIQRLRF